MNKKPQLFDPLFVLLSENDEKLMEYVQKGNKQAFEKLYERYKLKLFNFIVNMIKDNKRAEDLTQDVFLKVYKNADKYSPENKFSTWIFAIAKNTTIDAIRKKKETLIGSNEDGEEWIENQIDPNQDIEMQAIYKADVELLKKCMESLPINQKEALMMRVYSELSYDEIAKTLEKTLSSVKSLINRAKLSLDNCVKNCMEELT